MAENIKSGAERKIDPVTAERMLKARATREANKKNEVALNDSGKAALKLVQNARQACEILANKIKCGERINADSLTACGQLSTALAGLLVG